MVNRSSTRRILVMSVFSILVLWNYRRTSRWEVNERKKILSNSVNVTTTSSNVKDNNDGNSHPSDLRIVFVGDSLTRYTYLSLTYYLKYSKWASNGSKLLEKSKNKSHMYSDWNDWLTFSHSVIQPNEIKCDCYRFWNSSFSWYKHCENRYFIDHERRNYVTFITKFGRNPFHGHVMADNVFRHRHEEMNLTLRHYEWSYRSWSDFIDQYISQWNPKPDYFIFNQGHWKGHDLRSHDILQSIKTSLDKAGIRGIYRTTTFRSDETNLTKAQNSVLHKHDKKVCQYFDCINVSWTFSTPPSDYVDPVHFSANVSNQMTQQILEFLKQK